jgi:chromate transporter
MALMTGVTVQLGRASLTGYLAALIALLSLAVLLRWRINSTWLVLGGVAAGLLHTFV